MAITYKMGSSHITGIAKDKKAEAEKKKKEEAKKKKKAEKKK